MNNPQYQYQEFPLEKDLMMPNEKGELVELKRNTSKVEVSNYWARKSSVVGLVLGFSALILLVVFLQETNIFSPIWSSLISGLLGLVGIK